jgi:hypothetical protein
VEQTPDQGCGKRVSTRQTEGRAFIGVEKRSQDMRGQPEERRDVMRRHVSMLRLRLRVRETGPMRTRAAKEACISLDLPGVHSTVAEQVADHSRPVSQAAWVFPVLAERDGAKVVH